jgi:hypothetical protein
MEPDGGGQFFDEPEAMLWTIYVNAFRLPEGERGMFMSRYKPAQDALLDWLGLEVSEQVRRKAWRFVKEGDRDA